ncbi:MAG: phospholipase D family protein [candidate division Zixibacteria bacterium]
MKVSKLTCRVIAAVFVTSLASCASLPPNTDRTESHAYEDTWETALGRSFADRSQGHNGESAFYLLGDGLDALVARAVLADMAERSIDTQYYMIHNDVVGSLFIDKLYDAAERGVRVRLLIDDIDQGGRDIATAILDAHPNVEVRIINPFGRKTGRTIQFVTGFGKQTRRAHNKSFTVDNQATILGGRNIGDEYFNADPELAFADMDVLSIGPVARLVSSSFDLYWNSELSYPISTLVEDLPTDEEVAQRKKQFNEFVAQQYDSEYMQHLRDSDLAKRIGQNSLKFSWGVGEVVADDPAKLTPDTGDSEYRLTEQLRPYMEGVETELIILSPYFVPGKAGVAFLKTLREKGARVRILTNSLSSTDVSAVHAGYSRYRKALLRMGVELYELNKNLSAKQRKVMKEGGIGSSKASLHAKTFVIDRKQVFIGSLNLDPRSIIQNTEIGVVFESTELAERMADGFDRKIDQIAFRLELQGDDQGHGKIIWHGLIDGTQQTLSVDPYTSFWKRFGVGFMRMFPIESQI